MKYILKCLVLSFVAAFVAVAVCLAGQARTRISSIASHSFNADDVRAEIDFGRDLAARILANYPLLNNESVNNYVNLIGRALTLFCGRNELNFCFAVLDSDEINAFAAPGGYVFVTSGALARMKDEAQLASVLGHEIAHIVQRHMVNELKIRGGQGSTVGGLAGLIGGASGGVRSGLEASLNFGAEILFDRGYRMEDELEADRVGLLIAASAGYDPTALKRFLKDAGKFESEVQTKSKNHPVLAERLDQIEQTLAEYGLSSISQPTLKERFHEMVSLR
jgi:predicted Zn-dependent protease